MEKNVINVPKELNIANLEPIKIEKNNNTYYLNIEVDKDIIIFSINDKDKLLSINYIKAMSYQEIKDLNKVFCMLNSINEFYDYLERLSKNNKLNIEKNEEKISIILNIEVFLKQEIIEINLYPVKKDLDLNIKNIYKEILYIKKKINDIDILKNENKELREKVGKQNKEIKSIKENEINKLKEKFEKQNKEINNIKEKQNEINELKDKIEKLIQEIKNIKKTPPPQPEKQVVSLPQPQTLTRQTNPPLSVPNSSKIQVTVGNSLSIPPPPLTPTPSPPPSIPNASNIKVIEGNSRFIPPPPPPPPLPPYIQNESVIMKADEMRMIFSTIEKKMNKKIKKIKKLYQATIDGGDPINFHSKCDNIGNTLVIIKSEGFRRFGGFTPIPWKSNIIKNYISDHSLKTFVFSLDNQKIYYLIKKEKSVYHYKDYGPCFGEGHDIGIVGNPIKEKVLYTCQLSYDYKGDQYSLSEYKYNKIFNKKKIKALEYKVFQFIFF